MIVSNTFTGAVLILTGLLSILGAALDWRIIMRPGKLFNRLVGEKAARPIYVALGIGLVVLGIGRVIGVDWLGL